MLVAKVSGSVLVATVVFGFIYSPGSCLRHYWISRGSVSKKERHRRVAIEAGDETRWHGYTICGATSSQPDSRLLSQNSH